MSEDQTPVLQAKNLWQYYGRVAALRGADFELLPNEILAVIGDNGAGKSSLIKCLSGAAVPDEGEILLDGKRVRFRTPAQAKAAGIETVYQTLAVAPALDIASNMYLGREIRRAGPLGRFLRFLDTPRMRDESQKQVKELGIATLQDITQAVETLSGGQRQAVAVARAAAFGSKVVILDEPTAALGVVQTKNVLESIKRVRDKGIAVVLISHSMPHVLDVCDRIQVLRLGRRVATYRGSDTSVETLVGAMTGALDTREGAA
jgi:fructose transport system ATP-binding protein